MKWDGTTLADVVKTELYSFFSNAIPADSRMSNTEYADLLKKKYNHSGGTGHSDKYKTYINARDTAIEIIFKEPVPVEVYGENSITLTWSMAARFIRAWEYEKAHDDSQINNTSQNTLSTVQDQWERTHLCGGSVYVEGHCEYLLEPTEDTVINGKEVKKCNPYCTSENKVRKIGSGGLWTGLSPKFCPRRKALEGQRATNTVEEDNKTMARKMQFDTAITKDMQSAASDSFMDNIKMIDIGEIKPSEDNFYEISDIELLADDIEREGLKHNLVVAKDSNGYRVKSGHRRLAAIKLLIEQKRRTGTKIPCYVDGNKTSAESQFDLIMLNATQRKYSDADVLHEYEEIARTFKALEAEGKPLKGRIRDNIAKVLNVSPAQVGKIENIKHNAIPEVEKAVKSGAMSISTANEVAKLSEEKQQEIVKETPKISHKDVKEIQKQEKPKPAAPSKIGNAADEDFEDDFDDIDDVWDDDDEDIAAADIAEKKLSVAAARDGRSLVLSVNEAQVLLEFINENIAYADDEDSITGIHSKLEEFVGKS